MSSLTIRNKVTVATSARAKNVTFDDTMLHCELEDGRIISVPLVWYPRLYHAGEEARNNWRLIGKGLGIHWPDLDEDLSVKGFLAGGEGSIHPVDRYVQFQGSRVLVADRRDE